MTWKSGSSTSSSQPVASAAQSGSPISLSTSSPGASAYAYPMTDECFIRTRAPQLCDVPGWKPVSEMTDDEIQQAIEEQVYLNIYREF